MPILLIIFVFLTVLNLISVIIQHGDVFNNAQEAKIYLDRKQEIFDLLMQEQVSKGIKAEILIEYSEWSCNKNQMAARV